MLSRLFITLTLVSSLSLMAAQEKPAEKKVLTKHFSKMALTASLAATCFGIYQGNPGLAGCGIGLATGLGCAAYEAKESSYPVLPWIPEYAARLGIITIISAQIKATRAEVQAVLQPFIGGSALGSWIGYLGYHIARYMDKE